MAISDDTIALAIPSALKSDHPDSALVVQALAVALAACEDSGGLNAKARMRDVHAALSSVYVPIFAAHIAKEDEDWNALKAKADRYVPTITVEWVNSGKGRKSYRLSGEREGTATAYRDTDGLWSTAVYFRGDDAPAESDASLARESGDSVRKALESLGYVVAWKAQEPADKATGKRAEVSVPEPAPIPEPEPAPIPEPAPAPEPTPEPADDDSEDEGGNPFILHVNPTPGKECPVCGIGKVVRVSHKAVRGADGSITGYMKTVNTSIKSRGGFIRDSYLEQVEKNGRTAWYNATHAKKDGGA